MKTKWLYKNNRTECILFMSGWGCDKHSFLKMKSAQFDVLLCYDYRDISITEEISRVFKTYSQLHLISWSLGVYIANLIFYDKSKSLASATAINGTLQPIDQLKGIPDLIFQKTIDNFNKKNLKNFYRRMCGDKSTFRQFQESPPLRTLSDQKEELVSLQQIIQSHSVSYNIFTTVIIAGKDMIFPYRNLKSAWKKHKGLIVKERYPHFCFYNWNSWDELIEETKGAPTAG